MSMKILSPTAILGYGFPEDSFRRGLALLPDVICVDAGSVDPGPYYLGTGKSFTDRSAVKRDLRLILNAAVEHTIPAIIGSAGGSGSRMHLDWCHEIVREIAHEDRLHFKLGLITADIPKSTVVTALEAGRVLPLEGLPPLTVEEIDASVNIVAQMGTEPIIAALDQGCQVVLAGRAYDPAVFAAPAIREGYDPGLAIHLGKILECAAIAAEPGSGADCVLGQLDTDRFELIPLSNERCFTPESVAAHSLYEKSDPYRLPGPGGYLDLTAVQFATSGLGRVMVQGSRFVSLDAYTIKLEGVRCLGYRTICLAGLRDPIMIADIEVILDEVHHQVLEMLGTDHEKTKVTFRQYGRQAVMGPWEPHPESGHEIGLVIEAVAATQELADTACSLTRSTLLHYGYAGRIATAGNLALPFSPSDISVGPVYVFSLYHLMESDPVAPFELIQEDIGTETEVQS